MVMAVSSFPVGARVVRVEQLGEIGGGRGGGDADDLELGA